MNKKFKYGLVLIICMFFVFVLSGCSAGEASSYEALEDTLKTTQKNVVLNKVDTYINFSDLSLSDEELTKANSTLVAVKSEINTNFDYSKIKEMLTNACTSLYQAIPEEKNQKL